MSKKKKKSKAGRFVISMSSDVTRLFIDILFYAFIAFAIVKLSLYAKNFCYQVFGNVQVADYEHGVEKDILIDLLQVSRWASNRR